MDYSLRRVGFWFGCDGCHSVVSSERAVSSLGCSAMVYIECFFYFRFDIGSFRFPSSVRTRVKVVRCELWDESRYITGRDGSKVFKGNRSKLLPASTLVKPAARTTLSCCGSPHPVSLNLVDDDLNSFCFLPITRQPTVKSLHSLNRAHSSIMEYAHLSHFSCTRH